MPKRYHHSERDGHQPARHMDNDYSDRDSRRMRERRDASMIHEDHSAPANLPQQVMIKYWENDYGYLPEVIDDTLRGIDKQIRGDDGQLKKGYKPHKI